MFPRIIKVNPIKEYILHLTFSDGAQGELDFSQKILTWRGVFTPLHDISFF